MNITQVLTFQLPGKLKAKQRPRSTKRGHMYTPKETINAESYIKEYFANRFPNFEPFGGPVSLEIDFYRRIPTSWPKWKQQARDLLDDCGSDLDNKAKTVLDALNGVAYTDDRQIFDLRVRKSFAEHDFTSIKITEYEQPMKPIRHIRAPRPNDWRSRRSGSRRIKQSGGVY